MNKPSMFYGATPFIFEKAKELRKKCTLAEEILWENLRNKKLNNFRYRQQHPIYQYIADFYCHQAKLVIELDGGIHELPENKKLDVNRDIVMRDFGIEVIRFPNQDVYNNIAVVLDKILVVSTERVQSLNP